MTEKIKSLWAEIESAVAVNEEELEALRIRLVGKKGIIPALFEEFKSASTEEKRETGKLLNDLKNKAQEKLQQLKDSMGQSVSGKASDLDLTLPADELSLGSRHPINIVRNRIIEIFARQGFTVSYGPEVEDDWHNFTA
ncbi:MAG: phenylalanine--tRNA ligase subunit alpha, partial [Bacteroidetes bacterium]|nr:phenylalanine--tRNA ligase subunit alpha [Bacteroidota bacterium]